MYIITHKSQKWSQMLQNIENSAWLWELWFWSLNPFSLNSLCWGLLLGCKHIQNCVSWTRNTSTKISIHIIKSWSISLWAGNIRPRTLRSSAWHAEGLQEAKKRCGKMGTPDGCSASKGAKIWFCPTILSYKFVDVAWKLGIILALNPNTPVSDENHKEYLKAEY